MKKRRKTKLKESGTMGARKREKGKMMIGRAGVENK